MLIALAGIAVWQCLSFGIASLLALAAAFLLERRLAAALVQPLGDGWLLAIPVVCGIAALMVHAINLQADQAEQTASSGLVTAGQWLAVLSLPIVAAALSLPGSPPIGFAMLRIITIGAELGLWRLRNRGPIDWQWRPGRPLPSVLPREQLATNNSVSTVSPTGAQAVEIVRVDVYPFESDQNQRDRVAPLHPEVEQIEADQNVTQKLVYGIEDGKAYINGLLRVAFVAGQRTVVAHVAFCPAFIGNPAIETEQTGGPDCEIRRTLSLPWGVRFELKLDTPAEESAEVVFEFSAIESAEQHPKNSNPTS